MKVIIRFFMTGFGFMGFGVVIHELYHYLTLKNVSNVCLNFGGSSVASVSGYGESSEIIAYIISSIILLVGVAFATYDLIKTKDWDRYEKKATDECKSRRW